MPRPLDRPYDEHSRARVHPSTAQGTRSPSSERLSQDAGSRIDSIGASIDSLQADEVAISLKEGLVEVSIESKRIAILSAVATHSKSLRLDLAERFSPSM